MTSARQSQSRAAKRVVANPADRILERLAMAFSRDRWIDRIHGVLRGALGEYVKVRLARAEGIPAEDWEREVLDKIVVVRQMLDPELTATKSRFNRDAAFAEAIRDAGTSADKVSESIREFLGYREVTRNSLEAERRILRMRLRAPTLILEMLTEHRIPIPG